MDSDHSVVNKELSLFTFCCRGSASTLRVSGSSRVEPKPFWARKVSGFGARVPPAAVGSPVPGLKFQTFWDIHVHDLVRGSGDLKFAAAIPKIATKPKIAKQTLRQPLSLWVW